MNTAASYQRRGESRPFDTPQPEVPAAPEVTPVLAGLTPAQLERLFDEIATSANMLRGLLRDIVMDAEPAVGDQVACAMYIVELIGVLAEMPLTVKVRGGFESWTVGEGLGQIGGAA